MSHTQCSAYRAEGDACSNGFIQKSFCRGDVGCSMCGAISERSLPHCLKDELPAHFVAEDGKPLFVTNGK